MRNQGLRLSTDDGAPRPPRDVVSRSCALQAQDYLGSLWAIGLRTGGCTQDEIEREIAARSIVRTWPMRGTLHFVAAEDVRWMLGLLAPRAIERAAGRHRQLGLDAETIDRAGALFASALEDDGEETRADMMQLLEDAGISTEGQRGYHLLWIHAQLGLICLGPMRGTQQTFVLLDDWVPPAEPLPREDALARVAHRYFAGHGPATVADLARWTGLTLTEARSGLAQVADTLECIEIEGAKYWSAEEPSCSAPADARLHLLPAFDEYVIGYADRRLILGEHYDEYNASVSSNGMFSPTVILDGRVIGTWKRIRRPKAVRIAVTLFEPLVDPDGALADAAERYGRFLGLQAELSW
jgi:hypothetical protein